MPKGYITWNSSQIGSISFDVMHIQARGGPDFPILSIMTELELRAHSEFVGPNQPSLTRPLTLMHFSGELCCPAQRQIAWFHEEVGLLGTDQRIAATSQVRIDIPLDLTTVTRIEQERNTNLDAALGITPFLAHHYPKQNGNVVEKFIVARCDSIAFSIPRSHWTDTVLPQLGYRGLEVLEIRIGNSLNAQALPKALPELEAAQKALVNGDWDKAVGHCRNTLETILSSRPLSLAGTARFKDRVNDFIQNHLTGLHARQARLLAEHMGLIWEISSQANHPSPVPFTRADAELIVRTTMALLEYFSRLLS